MWGRRRGWFPWRCRHSHLRLHRPTDCCRRGRRLLLVQSSSRCQRWNNRRRPYRHIHFGLLWTCPQPKGNRLRWWLEVGCHRNHRHRCRSIGWYRLEMRRLQRRWSTMHRRRNSRRCLDRHSRIGRGWTFQPPPHRHRHRRRWTNSNLGPRRCHRRCRCIRTCPRLNCLPCWSTHRVGNHRCCRRTRQSHCRPIAWPLRQRRQRLGKRSSFHRGSNTRLHRCPDSRSGRWSRCRTRRRNRRCRR